MPDVLALGPAFQETGQVAGLIIAVVGALYAVGRVIRTSWRFIRNVDETLSITKETHHLVRHHLGPNGQTPPLHRRVSDLGKRMRVLEEVHGVETPAELLEDAADD